MDINILKNYKCPCCEYFTYKEKTGNTFQLCPVCYWEDDGVQLSDPTYTGGANVISLIQARGNYLKFGACEERFVKFVRSPNSDEF